MNVALMNERTHQPVATRVEIAATRTTRRRGLLGQAVNRGGDHRLYLRPLPCSRGETSALRLRLGHNNDSACIVQEPVKEPKVLADIGRFLLQLDRAGGNSRALRPMEPCAADLHASQH